VPRLGLGRQQGVLKFPAPSSSDGHEYWSITVYSTLSWRPQGFCGFFTIAGPMGVFCGRDKWNLWYQPKHSVRQPVAKPWQDGQFEKGILQLRRSYILPGSRRMCLFNSIVMRIRLRSADRQAGVAAATSSIGFASSRKFQNPCLLINLDRRVSPLGKRCGGCRAVSSGSGAWMDATGMPLKSSSRSVHIANQNGRRGAANAGCRHWLNCPALAGSGEHFAALARRRGAR